MPLIVLITQILSATLIAMMLWLAGRMSKEAVQAYWRNLKTRYGSFRAGAMALALAPSGGLSCLSFALALGPDPARDLAEHRDTVVILLTLNWLALFVIGLALYNLIQWKRRL